MSGLNIYKASAGSGKTHQLAGEYLKLALNPNNSFKHILAVTFTKKATAEMRERILKELYLLSLSADSAHSEILKNEFNWTSEQLQQRALQTLNQILNNFSQFQISTIDSFFQTILKSFTRELGVNAGFTVDIDMLQAIEISVGQFFEHIHSNTKIKNWLTTYATRKIERGQHWDIQTDILKFVKSAFSEEFFSLPESYLAELSKMDHFETIQTSIEQYLKNYIAQMNLLGQQGIELIKKAGLDVDSFSFKKTGVAGYFYKLAHCNKYSFSIPNLHVHKALNSVDGIEGWCAKNSIEKSRIQAAVQGGLQKTLNDFFTYYELKHLDFFTALEIERNLASYAIVVLVYNQLLSYSNEQNIFLLPLTTPLLSKMVHNSDAPFIYEKTGNFLKNFMIDEFQDTSTLQWKNFRPLIANSLAQGNSTLVVGDVKQSIYRWRYGNWNLLHSQLKNDFEKYQPTEITLPYNWRSSAEVVQFNNWCFTHLPKLIDEQLFNNFSKPGGIPSLKLEDVFQGAEQMIPEKGNSEKGFVSLQFFETNDEEQTFEEKSISLLINDLKELFTLGYQPRDIAIIVRRNREGAAVAKSLMEYKTNYPEWEPWFNFVSNDSVLLSASDSINYIVSAIRFLIEPSNPLNNSGLAFYFANQTLTASQSAQLLSQINFNDEKSVMESFPTAFVNNLDRLKRLPLSTLTEELLKLLIYEPQKINLTKEWAFIHSFKDLIRQYTNTQGEDVAGFLEWWEDKAKDTAITISEEQNAIRILTIHKSKGLEYKVVLLPFFHWNIEQKEKLLWCQTRKMDFLPSLWFPINYSSKLIHTHLKDEFFIENLMVWADNLNLLYVAFTRAKKVLLVYTIKPKNEDDIKSMGGLLYHLVNHSKDKSEWDHEKLKFSTGNLTTEQKGSLLPTLTQESNPYQIPNNRKINLRFRTNQTDFLNEFPENSFLHKGKIYHALFAKVKTKNDFGSVLKNFSDQGIIDEQQVNELHTIWKQAITIPMIESWFNGSYQVFNEATIVLPNGETKRPDRVLLNNESCIVIDFKISTHHLPEHKQQVQEYVQILKEMKNVPTKGYLWYIPNHSVIEV